MCDPGTCVRSPRAARRLAELCLVLSRGFSWPPLPSWTTAGSKHQTRGAVPCTSLSQQIVWGGRSDWQNRYRNSGCYSWPGKLTTEVLWVLIVLQKMSLEILDLQLSTRKLCIGGPEPPCHVGCGRADLQLHLKKKNTLCIFFQNQQLIGRRQEAGPVQEGSVRAWGIAGPAGDMQLKL